MANHQLNILESETDPRKLMLRARELARSPDAADQNSLRTALLSPAVLDRLDSQEDYEHAGHRRLRLSRVLSELVATSGPGAGATLRALLTSRHFVDEPIREVYLLEFSAGLRPPPPELLAFWEAERDPDEGLPALVFDAVITNGSPKAIAVAEQMLADPRYDEEERVFWIRTTVLERRDDLVLLHGCTRMMARGVSLRLRIALAEVLFDYRPDEWHPIGLTHQPPDRARLGIQSRRQLELLGRLALELPIDDRLRERIDLVHNS